MKFIVHDQPTFRAESNYIAQIALGPFGFDDHSEQVWLRRTTDELAELCCIPFRAYGLALLDTVRISPDGTVTEVVSASGRRVLRTLLVAAEDPATTRGAAADLEEEVAGAGLLFEWSGDRHLAIDVPEGAGTTGLMDYLDAGEAAGRLYWEWADAEPFTV